MDPLVLGSHQYGNEVGDANKEKGQYMFSDQFGFIFLNIEAESEAKGGCPSEALCKGQTTQGQKGCSHGWERKSKSQPTRDRDIKCFNCLRKGHIAS
jgi:hypothetical protein